MGSGKVRNPMPFPRRALFAAVRAAGAGGLLLAATLLHAVEGGFTTTLSPDQQAAAGLTGLSPAERAALDQLVASETAESRVAEGKVLSGTFASRRTEAERQAAGLDRLSEAELARLNEMVANVAISRPKPKERPRLKDDDVVSAKTRPEVHGSVSLTFGHGPGGSFRGADLWLSYYIPEYGLSLGFGMSRYTGGFLPYDYYNPGSFYWSPATRGPMLLEPDTRELRREDFSAVTGRSFRAASPWGSVSFSRSRP